ncbi:hypothetical protein BCV69DRAFT_294404 [Microstroma glucosiphilum]|uniref:Uncharacterized protein n=1 Tax=Pseudomicrostroma glucosiphilum TaxID=1684307 RepID=A0A316U386_9BASI|nr:hypothetical protein BCV69DRAFT_294404 [Pseudomicrostroma glucosiphilum]PWN19640.1 hypothetical protein BCV69DRAFT_294404 [Pseudomicrostroma glucosiphilum]
MGSRRMLQKITLVFALLLLLALLSQAESIEARSTKKALTTKHSSHKAKTTTTLSIKSAHKSKTTQSKKSTKKAKKTSTKATTTHKATTTRKATSTHKASSTPKATSTTQEATSPPPLLEDFSSTPVKATKDESKSSVFCKSFVKQCYTEALKGQTGNVAVVYSCQRNGKKDSTSYTYSCKRGKTNLVSKVLNALGNQYTVLTTVDKTTVTTGTTTAVQTAYAVESVTVATEISKTIITKTETDTSLVPTATTVLTTKIPYTATGTTTSIVTETSTSTEYVVGSTTTSTAVFLGTDGVPVEDVKIGGKLERRRRDLDKFCSAFQTACATECKENSSKVKTTVCKAKKDQEYTVACACKNGDLLTQHALAAVVEEQYISTIETLRRSTAWLATTRTTTISGATSSTRFVTFTTTLPRTQTFTTLATSTIASTLTKYTGISAAVETSHITMATTTTTTIPTLAPIEATVTTQTVLASTGYARATIIADGMVDGYLAANPSGWAQLTGTYSDLVPQDMMAIRDARTGSYQLAILGEPDTVLISESAYASFSGDDNAGAYGYMYFGDKSLCGTAGSEAGPSAGQGAYGRPCETFLFHPIVDDDTSSDGSALLQGFWVNEDSGMQQTEWTYIDQGSVSPIYQVPDSTTFGNRYGVSEMAFNMTFPVNADFCRREEGNLERRMACDTRIPKVEEAPDVLHLTFWTEGDNAVCLPIPFLGAAPYHSPHTFSIPTTVLSLASMVRIAFTALALALFGLVKASSSLSLSDLLDTSAIAASPSTLYNCGLCQVTAASKTKITLTAATQCFQNVSSAVVTQYAGNSKTAYKLSTTKPRRLQAQDGTPYFVKSVGFTRLNIVPDEEDRGFSKQGFACGDGIIGGVQCFDCTKVKAAST